jgi:hypothetical protein
MDEMEDFKVKYIKLVSSIVINYGDFSATIPEEDWRYPGIIQAIEDNELHKIPKIIHAKDIQKVKDLLGIKKTNF